jgi:hypothetical protein
MTQPLTLDDLRASVPELSCAHSLDDLELEENAAGEFTVFCFGCLNEEKRAARCHSCHEPLVLAASGPGLTVHRCSRCSIERKMVRA